MVPRRVVLGGVLAFCVVLLTSAFLLSGSDGARTSEGRRPALVLSPTGSDQNPCTQGAPCRSFERALERARPGQTVLLAGGRYEEQTLPAREAGGSARIVFQPARGARVTVDGTLVVRASRVELRDLAAQAVKIEKARGVVLRRLDVNLILVNGARSLAVLGGDVGPSENVESQVSSFEGSIPRGIRFVGVRFHDARKSDPEAHVECLQIGSAIGLVVRRSTFTGCADHDIFVRSWGSINGDRHPLRNVLIEGNRFDRPDRGQYSLRLGKTDGWPCESFRIQANVALANMYSDCEARDVRFSGNAQPTMSTWSCGEGGAVWDHNLYGNGVRCGPHDRVSEEAYGDLVRSGSLLDRPALSGGP